MTVAYISVEKLVEDYYRNRFNDQLNTWKLKTNAHNHSDGLYVSLSSLRPKCLSWLPPEDHALFYCAVACSVLIDQVMYTYFSSDYPKFQSITRYPKVEGGLSGFHVRPWEIASLVDPDAFGQFCKFFLQEMQIFFNKHKFQNASWEAVKSAMLSDKDMAVDVKGSIVIDILGSL